MIKSFGDKKTATFAQGGRVKQFAAFARQAAGRLTRLDAAQSIHDLMTDR